MSAIPEVIRFHSAQNHLISTQGVANVTLSYSAFREVLSGFQSVGEYILAQPLCQPMLLTKLSYLLLVAVSEMSRASETLASRQCSHQEVVFQHFLQLLCRHYTEQHYIDFYADALGTSSSYLQRVVRQVSGRTVRSYIAEQLYIQARRLLSATDLTAEQVAYQLNFSSPSAFGKFFKLCSHQTPNQYRMKQKTD